MTVALARRFRRNQTEAEKLRWSHLRFWNHDVLTNIDGVMEAVLQELLLVR